MYKRGDTVLWYGSKWTAKKESDQNRTPPPTSNDMWEVVMEEYNETEVRLEGSRGVLTILPTQPEYYATATSLPYIQSPPSKLYFTKNANLKSGELVYYDDGGVTGGVTLKANKDIDRLSPKLNFIIRPGGCTGENRKAIVDFPEKQDLSVIYQENNLIPDVIFFNKWKGGKGYVVMANGSAWRLKVSEVIFPSSPPADKNIPDGIWEYIPPSPTTPEYDNKKIYKVGDKVISKGIVWIVKEAAGVEGYPPPADKNEQSNTWAYVPEGVQSSQAPSSIASYDNTKVYKLGEQVTSNGIVWVVKDATGAPGYKPPEDKNGQSNTWAYVSGGTSGGGKSRKARKNRKARKSRSRR